MFNGSNPNAINRVVEGALKKQSQVDLNEKELNLMLLCRLLVDIHYRHSYGTSLEGENDSAYSEAMYKNKVLADQTSPVDDIGSARLDQREVPGDEV